MFSVCAPTVISTRALDEEMGLDKFIRSETDTQLGETAKTFSNKTKTQKFSTRYNKG